MPLSKRILPHGKKSINAQSPNYYTTTGTLGDNNVLTGSTNKNGVNWTANLSSLAGGGGGSGTVAPSPQYEVPFYSVAGTANTITGTSTIVYDSSTEALFLTSTVAGNSSLKLTNTVGTSTANGLMVSDESDSTVLQVGFNNNTNETYFWSHGNNPIKIGTNTTERIRVLGDGKVGIGTLTPNELLDVSGNQKLYGHLEITGAVTDNPGNNHLWASGTGLYWGDQEVYVNQPGTGEITGAGTATYISYFDGGQNVTGTADFVRKATGIGIGTDDPSYKLDVRGALQVSGNIYHKGGPGTWMQSVNGSNGKWQLFQGATQRIIGSSGEFQFANDIIVDNNLIVTGTATLGSGSTTTTTATADNSSKVATTAWVKNQSYGSGDGTVGTSGTPVDNQISVFTDATTIEGDANFTFTNNNKLNIVPSNAEAHLQLGAGNVVLQYSGSKGRLYSANRTLRMGNTGAEIKILNGTSDSIHFFTNGTSDTGIERMTILSGGNVGIGETSPSVKLHVVGDALFDGYLHVDKDASPRSISRRGWRRRHLL